MLRALGPDKDTTEDMLTPVFRILERMAKDKNNIQRIRDNDGVELLVQQLELHPDNEVILRAGGRLLAKVAEGDLAKMIERLQNGNLSEAAKLLAIGLISNLALQPENIPIIIQNGMLIVCVRCMLTLTILIRWYPRAFEEL